MKFLRRLRDLLRALLLGSLPAWRELFGKIRELIRRAKQEETGDRSHRVRRAPCIPIDHPAYKRPDPMIYAQFYLMELGLAVTWDNPDIQIWKDGALVPSSQLEKDTEYEIRARIWNNSTEAPVLGLPVFFAYLSFGIGTQSHFIGTTQVDLGVKGGPGQPAHAVVTWKTPAEEGHYCIQVLLVWGDDLNPKNNYGQENTEVSQPHSPATHRFILRNATKEAHLYRFEVDTYVIPEPPRCGDSTGAALPFDARVYVPPPAHERKNYAVPPGWSVRIDPSEPRLDPEQEATIQVTISAPDGFKGRRAFNVNAFHRRGMAGGVTLYVEAGSSGK